MVSERRRPASNKRGNAMHWSVVTQRSCRGAAFRFGHRPLGPILAHIVAARDANEAAYNVTGEHLRSEGERGKVRLRVHRLGNGSPPPKLFYTG